MFKTLIAVRPSTVPYLASHILAQMAKVVAVDWQRVYNHRVYYLETFVDKERFAGSCYKAANWIYLGDTTGRGKNAPEQKSQPVRLRLFLDIH